MKNNLVEKPSSEVDYILSLGMVVLLEEVGHGAF